MPSPTRQAKATPQSNAPSQVQHWFTTRTMMQWSHQSDDPTQDIAQLVNQARADAKKLGADADLAIRGNPRVAEIKQRIDLLERNDGDAYEYCRLQAELKQLRSAARPAVATEALWIPPAVMAELSRNRAVQDNYGSMFAADRPSYKDIPIHREAHPGWPQEVVLVRGSRGYVIRGILDNRYQ